MANLPHEEGVMRGAATVPEKTHAGVWVLAATILGSSMVFIDGTVVNVALPALQTSLNATVTDVQWVVEAYALFLAALLLVGGSLGDLYGRRRIFLVGVVLFAGASAWCGFAFNVRELIVARGLQGVGGALLVPGSLALISSSFCAEDRGRAIGTWSGFTAITTAVGPVLGGWLIEHLSWRWAFFVNLPLAVLVVLISLAKVSESRDKEMVQRLDGWGAVMATVGLCGMTFALIEAGRGGERALIAGGVGVLALAGFFVVESRSEAPMLPLDLFRSRTFGGANLMTLFLYGALSGVLFFLPLDLIQVQYYSATQAGGALLPLILLIFLLSRWSGGLVVRYGARLPLIVGPLIAGVGFGLFLRGGVGGSYWGTVFPAVVVLGLGLAVSVAPLTTTVMGSIDQSRAGVASGINNAVSRVAGLLAVAVMGLVFSVAFNARLERGLDGLALPAAQRQAVEEQRGKLAAARSDDVRVQRLIGESFVGAYGVVLWIAVGLSAASALSAAMLIEARPEPQRVG
ncbi:MFS transporter [Granulicella sp. L60]|uniref:MFS transporter n=1 Tax=Granulicella sp. L60 TaxID=1641866 RepID=UPI00131B72EE|nr:MFS transporter [Granulicella sp. L60]